LDTDWSQQNDPADSFAALGGEDGKAMIWKVGGSVFQGEGWSQDVRVPQDFDPVLRVALWKIGQMFKFKLFHLTTSNCPSNDYSWSR
jgi:hypothetical protein